MATLSSALRAHNRGGVRWISDLRMSLTFLLCFALCTVEISGECQPGKPLREAGVFFPDLTSESFKAEMAGFSTTEYGMMSFKEHFSKESGRGSVHTEGPTSNYLFFLTENDTMRAFGNDGGCLKVSKQNEIVSLIRVVRRALDPDKATFIESTNLMGIPVYHWRICYPFSLDDGSENLVASLDTFITYDDQWQMYTGTKDVLLRLSVDIFVDDVFRDNYYLDFLQFEKMQYDANIFQADLEPPLGLPCTGLNQDMNQPQVPSSASFRRETVARHGEHRYISDRERVVFDTENQVIERKTSIATSVRDFNHGASYLIMRIKGHSTSCLTMPINKLETQFLQQDINSGVTFKDHYVSMDSVKDYLYLSGDFTFNGEYRYRGIPCDVFTHITTNYAGKRQRAKILLFFSKPGVVVADRSGLSKENKLVKIEIRVDDVPPIIHNIYNQNIFDFDKALEAPYDISPCFDEQHRIEFKLDLEELKRTHQVAMTANERRALEHDVRNFIAEMCGLDFVRVHVGTAVERHGTVSLTGKLFARPDSGVHFEHFVRKSFGNGRKALNRVVSTMRDVSEIASCANQAYLNSDASDADYCLSLKVCILYRGASSDQEEITLVDDDPCEHLTKVRGFKDLTSMSAAWDTLQRKVSKDKMVLELKVGDKIFKISNVKKINDPNARLHKISPLSSFKKISSISTTTAEGQKLSGKTSLKECADQCLNRLLFPCEAFSYCKDTSSCELYDSFDRKVSGQESDIGRAPSYTVERNCEIYMRYSLHNFERQPGTVARMTTSSSDVEVTDIAGVEDCARLCMDRNDFQCESFDFCSPDGLSGNCLLHKQHWREFTWVKEGSPEQNCSHFSRNYIWDYTKMDGITNFPVSGSVTMAGGVEACAFQCSSSAKCNTFNYCEGGDLCQYIDSSAGKPTLGDVVPTYRCYTFVQKDTADVISRHDILVDKLERKQASSGGYSSGAMAGLAFAMLVLGVCLCFLGLYSWTLLDRYRNNNKDRWDNAISMDNPNFKNSL